MPTLNWIGKDRVVSHHQDVPYRILEHKYGFTAENGEQDEATNSGNKIIHGDNLEALKSLLPEYEGKIKCIYIDPPYNTGNEKWVYNDNVNHPKIKKWLGEVVGKDGEDLSRHDKWLCMMYPRLKLLQKLLAEDGAIFISIDDNEQANLKLLCDEIFGVSNCIGPLIQNKQNSKNDAINIQKNHEYILVYRKSKISSASGKTLPTLVNKKRKAKKVYQRKGKYYYLNDYITTRGEGGVLNARPNLGHTIYYNHDTSDIVAVCDYDLEVAKTSNNEDEVYSLDNERLTQGYVPIRPPRVRGKLGCWTWSLDKINSSKENLLITGKKDKLRVRKITYISKEYVSEVEGQLILNEKSYSNSRSILDFSTNDGSKILSEVMGENGSFDNPKNVPMLEYLIDLIADRDSIVLDSFAGSGSTGHAVLNLNSKDGGTRKFILIELEKYAERLTATRLKNLITGFEFTGKKKEVIYSYPTSITSLKNANEILEQYEDIKMSEIYNKVKIESLNDNIIITGEIKIAAKVEGLGGSFDFIELGLPLFDANQNLNEEVGIEKIREYIWYSETRTSYQASDKEDYFLGDMDQSVYYFIYEKDRLKTLDYDSLDLIKTKGEQYIIYADNCLLPKDFMAKKNIIFKKIPRDITRF